MPIDQQTSRQQREETVFESILPGYQEMDVAIAHYWFVTWRGGEKVVRAMLDLFPKADIYTLFYDKRTCGPYLDGHRIISSRLDMPILRRQYQKLFPLYPYAVRSLHMDRSYDLVISSESGPIKGIRLPNRDIPHLCYIHTPMRYCWEDQRSYLQSLPSLIRPIAKRQFDRLRTYDLTTIDNVTCYIANSENVRGRVERYYHREAEVIYPPIADELFEKHAYRDRQPGDFYLSFGALAPYKRIDLLVDAFNRNGRPLVVIGDGSELKGLRSRARENIQFLGAVDWETVEYYVSRAKALLFPGVEDFGMIPLEVMAYGLPVLAFASGGALETVIDDPDCPERSTGCFFHEQSVEAVLRVIERFEDFEHRFDTEFLFRHAKMFCEEEFKKKLLRAVSRMKYV